MSGSGPLGPLVGIKQPHLVSAVVHIHIEVVKSARCRGRERRRGQVVREARLWCKNSPYGCEFEAGLRHATTGKISLLTQQ